MVPVTLLNYYIIITNFFRAVCSPRSFLVRFVIMSFLQDYGSWFFGIAAEVHKEISEILLFFTFRFSSSF